MEASHPHHAIKHYSSPHYGQSPQPSAPPQAAKKTLGIGWSR